MKRWVRALWPMLVWMGVLFCMSTDFGSAAHTGRIIDPLLRWLDPTISPEALERAHLIVRKGAHVTEYAVLAILVLRALRILRDHAIARWSWSLAGWALAASAAYGATDEFHQTFVPSRGPSIHDVVIDSCGAIVGLTIVYLWTRRRHEPLGESVGAK
jgi:VanZ family protein